MSEVIVSAVVSSLLGTCRWRPVAVRMNGMCLLRSFSEGITCSRLPVEAPGPARPPHLGVGGVGGGVLLSTQAAASVVNKEERRLPVVSFLLPQPQTGAVSHLITLLLISPDVCWKIVRPTKKGGGKKRKNSSVTLHGANNKEVERRLESAGIRGEEE